MEEEGRGLGRGNVTLLLSVRSFHSLCGARGAGSSGHQRENPQQEKVSPYTKVGELKPIYLSYKQLECSIVRGSEKLCLDQTEGNIQNVIIRNM